ncbi:MAG: hypothetical protein ACR2KQ_04955 [Actinomycetota bacterium]
MTADLLPIRAATRADLQGILAVSVARGREQAGRAMSDGEDVEWRWREAGFDPDRDTWVATDQDRVVAYTVAQGDEIEVPRPGLRPGVLDPVNMR